MKVIPIGLQCSVPLGILNAKMREYSYPFDRLWTPSKTVYNILKILINNGIDRTVEYMTTGYTYYKYLGNEHYISTDTVTECQMNKTTGLGITHYTINNDYIDRLKKRLERLLKDIKSNERILFIYADAASPKRNYYLDNIEYGVDANKYLLKINELIYPINNNINIIYFCWNERKKENGIIEYITFEYKKFWKDVALLIHNYLENKKYPEPIIYNKKLNDIDVNLLPKDMKEELDKLPQHIRDIIIVNTPYYPKSFLNGFAKFTKSKEIIKLEKNMIDNICVADKSIYDMSYEEKIDGFIIRVLPKDINIYRAELYLMSEKKFNDECRKKLDKPIWIGNKYICCALCSNFYGGLISLKINRPVYLIDIYNLHNLEKIYDILSNEPEDVFGNVGKQDFLITFKIINGYKISLSEKIKYIYKNQKKKIKNINIYTNNYANSSNYNYCKIYVDNDIKPYNNIYIEDSVYSIENILYDIILKKYPKIDGIIRKLMKSDLDIGGVYRYEEITIKGYSLLNNTKYDYLDPLCWVNWKKINIYSDLELKYNNDDIFSTNMYKIKNKYFLFKYYLKNKPKNIKLKKKYIMSYNVNYFNNLMTDTKDNFDNVINLIKQYNENLKIIMLIDYPNNKLDIIQDKLNSLYNYIKYTDDNNNTKILVLSNNKYINKINIFNITLSSNELMEIGKNITEKYNNEFYTLETNYNNIIKFSKMNKNIIILDTIYGLIACIHLEYGYFIIYDDEKEMLSQINTQIRLKMIDKILEQELKPDIIIGDFNFTLDDEETKYLQSKNYFPQNKQYLSTPINRTDHCFMKDKFVGKNRLLKCNYSIHLPMIQSIE